VILTRSNFVPVVKLYDYKPIFWDIFLCGIWKPPQQISDFVDYAFRQLWYLDSLVRAKNSCLDLLCPSRRLYSSLLLKSRELGLITMRAVGRSSYRIAGMPKRFCCSDELYRNFLDEPFQPFGAALHSSLLRQHVAKHNKAFLLT
jgi:hypothetical protein